MDKPTPDQIKTMNARQRFLVWWEIVQSLPQEEIAPFNREYSEALLGPAEKVVWLGKKEKS